MSRIAKVILLAVFAISVLGLVGCGKNDMEKKQEAALKELAEYKGEDGGGQPVSEDEAKAQIEQSRKEYEEQTKKGAPAGHMSMDEFKKMAESKKK